MSGFEDETCVWHPMFDPQTLEPMGTPCGAPATHVILWLDGTFRWSPACDRHTELDPAAPPSVTLRLRDA